MHNPPMREDGRIVLRLVNAITRAKLDITRSRLLKLRDFLDEIKPIAEIVD